MADVDDSLLLSTPPPIITELALYTPTIRAALRIAKLLSWHSAYRSFLILFAWWAICLLSWPIFRWGLPALLMFTLFEWSARHQQPFTGLTEEALRQTLADLRSLRGFFPESFIPNTKLSAFQTVRIVIVIYPAYLTVFYFVPAPIVCGILGTLFLTIRAPWSKVLGRALWRSAFIRNSCYHIGGIIAGTSNPTKPSPPSIDSFSTFALTKVPKAPPKTQGSEDQDGVKFLITICENQRWWLGLDWTSATLPAERPPWSSSAHPYTTLEPPSEFMLPKDTAKSKWRWLDSEWKVLIHREGEVLVVEEGSEETDRDGWIYGDNKWENTTNVNGMGKYTRTRKWVRVAMLQAANRIATEDFEAATHDSSMSGARL